ncbi:MAG: hypothetical protein HY906_07860 [Deltaproteobacteria bacterium]|nr:hypothetical protein [Deltaproteobacteria bacterium]
MSPYLNAFTNIVQLGKVSAFHREATGRGIAYRDDADSALADVYHWETPERTTIEKLIRTRALVQLVAANWWRDEVPVMLGPGVSAHFLAGSVVLYAPGHGTRVTVTTAEEMAAVPRFLERFRVPAPPLATIRELAAGDPQQEAVLSRLCGRLADQRILVAAGAPAPSDGGRLQVDSAWPPLALAYYLQTLLPRRRPPRPRRGSRRRSS